jgi:hypothetical protein
MEDDMATWFKKELGDGKEAFTPSNQILESFLPSFAAAGSPTDMAVFSRYDLRKSMVTVYFSPAAKSLAVKFSAEPCGKPAFEEGLGLLVGDQRSVGNLFPETQGE